jgi:Dyp-type peroxidase family
MSTPHAHPISPLNLHRPVDEASEEWRQTAEVLQGNIAKGHGRDYSAHILFEIASQPGSHRKLKELAERYVTSARQQQEQSDAYHAARECDPQVIDKQLFGSLYLSASGYQALGFSKADLDTAFPDPEGIAGAANWFLTGMEQQSARLADPPRSAWEIPYRYNRLDAMLLLACDDEAKLRTVVAEALTAMDGFAKPIHIEWGITLRDSNERAIEHFGFADGISQPAIFNDSAAQVLPRHLLVPDMLARSNNAFGSYLVFRKLEQHVKEFELAVEQLAKSAEVSVEYAGAMVLGRFKDGTPLTHSILPKGQRVQDPDLLGHDDIRGTKCPFHAHIRKVNPRVNSQGRPVSLPLVRRGVPYGSYCRGAVRSEPVGLLFMAFQADLGRQFGIITIDSATNNRGCILISPLNTLCRKLN